MKFIRTCQEPYLRTLELVTDFSFACVGIWPRIHFPELTLKFIYICVYIHIYLSSVLTKNNEQIFMETTILNMHTTQVSSCSGWKMNRICRFKTNAKNYFKVGQNLLMFCIIEKWTKSAQCLLWPVNTTSIIKYKKQLVYWVYGWIATTSYKVDTPAVSIGDTVVSIARLPSNECECATNRPALLTERATCSMCHDGSSQWLLTLTQHINQSPEVFIF